MTFIKNNSYLLLIMVLCILFALIGMKPLGSVEASDEIIVSEGDTLWSLSIQYGEDMPNEKWIQEVIKLNNLSSTQIQTGSDLKLPLRNGLDHKDIATNLASDRP